jgi:hypothetical protein
MGMLALASALPAFGGDVAVSWLYALSLGGAYGAYATVLAVCCGLSILCGAGAFVISCPSAKADREIATSPISERTS